MACCGKQTKFKNIIVPDRKVITTYKEGQDGYVTINYLDNSVLRIKGCVSGHIYLFANYAQYIIDSNDAACLFDMKPGLFEEVVVYAIASDFSTDEINTTES